MIEGYDDYDETGLEQILAEEPEIIDFENTDAWQEEVDRAIWEVTGDLYRLHANENLEEIETNMDLFRVKTEAVDDHHEWQDEVGQAIAKARQNEG